MAQGSPRENSAFSANLSLSEALASGDLAKMSAARDAAFGYVHVSSEAAQLLLRLERAINSNGGVISSLSALTIQDAITRGDSAELNHLKGQLAYYTSLLLGSSGGRGPVVPPYGVAIQDAKSRGDKAEIKRLTEWAQSLLEQLNADK